MSMISSLENLTSLLIYVVDENGSFDETMTKMLPSLYNVSTISLPLPVSSKEQYQIEFEPVSLQTQISFNVQTKVQFKIPRIRNRSNPQKNDQIWTKKHYPNQAIMRKTNKKGGKKKEGNLPKPLPSFFIFRPLLSLFPTTIYIKIKKL